MRESDKIKKIIKIILIIIKRIKTLLIINSR